MSVKRAIILPRVSDIRKRMVIYAELARWESARSRDKKLCDNILMSTKGLTAWLLTDFSKTPLKGINLNLNK